MDTGERAWSGCRLFLCNELGRALWAQEVHCDDGTGHCAGCRAQVRWVRHPCFVRQLADESINHLIPIQRTGTE